VLREVRNCPARAARHVLGDVGGVGDNSGERRDLPLGLLAEPVVIKHEARLPGDALGTDRRALAAEAFDIARRR
jgi:hypothetical protein